VLSSDPLIQAAAAVREQAHAPYSGFKVGAAVEDADGRIYTGCNVENATYGLTICAERLAVFKAISERAAKLVRVAVVTDAAMPAPPCGACRQIIWEFCGNATVVMANLGGHLESITMEQIFPRPFDASSL
jgi:cytidine deaminase